MNKLLLYGYAMLKRSLILCLPMFFMGMVYIEVGISADYKNILNWYIVTGIIIIFYAICAWCIISSFNLRRIIFLGLSILMIWGFIRFNDEIYHNWKTARCIDASVTQCN